MRDQGLTFGRRQLDEQWRQQPLALERTGRESLHHLLEQHPLVGDVLIDDRDPLIVDGNDERVSELTEGDHWSDRTGFYGVLRGSAGFYEVRFGSAGFGKVLRNGLHQVA